MTHPDRLYSPADYDRAVEAFLAFAAALGQPAEAILPQLRLYERIVEYEQRRRVRRGVASLLEARLACVGPAPEPRRTALVTDIHGNLGGLLAALEDAERCGCERVVCLGDCVDGGKENEEVVAELRRRAIPIVRGNHDEENDLELRPETHAFLRGLPEQIVEGDVLFTHISPRARKRLVQDPSEAWQALDESPYRLAFIGHTHRSFIFGEKGSEAASARSYEVAFNEPFPIDPLDRYVVCVGAVGYSRDLIDKIRYVIYDPRAGTLEFRMIEGPILRF